MTTNTARPSYRHLLYGLCLAILLGACQRDEFYNPAPTGSGSSMQLSFISDPMQQYKVPTRNSDPKDDKEKSIHNLHIFFFDANGQWLEGTYLEGYPSASANGGYLAPGQGSTLIKIANATENFDNYEAAKTTSVYAVANVKASLFRELDEEGRPQCLHDIMDTTNITNPKDALLSIQYTPDAPIFLVLPEETGMPMMGHTVTPIDLTHTEHPNPEDHVIQLKALMARIDVNIRLNAGDGTQMILTEWSAHNLPTGVSFTATNPETDTTSLPGNTESIGSNRTQQIYNKQGEIAFSFYMFENVQQPKEFNYPEGVQPEEYQRWKPVLANNNATYVELNTQFIDSYGDGRNVTYKLYLGANHTDNFAIERNHQYKNNVVIKGIKYVGNAGDHVTYDARVDITENTNSYYIAMLHTELDAHFCVLPMDVYFFNTDEETQLTVELEGNPDWIAMELIPANHMLNGTAPTSPIVESDNPLLASGARYHAGNGKRSFFTPTLVSALNRDNEGEVIIENSRDRIYFYVDENLSADKERTATILLTYSGKNVTSETEKLTITQTHFWEVSYYDDDYEENRTIYMEQYEEYLDHYDPLDEFATDQIYGGLPWGVNGETISDFHDNRGTTWNILDDITVEAQNNYYRGLEFTNKIIHEDGGSNITLNDTPQSAAEYCYNRNKRDSKGNVSSDNQKWFLPGITQMETALAEYYTQFPEFQDYFYWSSSAAKEFEDGWFVDSYPQDPDRARATKAFREETYVFDSGDEEDEEDHWFMFAPSDWNNMFEGHDGLRGNASRDESLRIRAFRTDLEPVE